MELNLNICFHQATLLSQQDGVLRKFQPVSLYVFPLKSGQLHMSCHSRISAALLKIPQGLLPHVLVKDWAEQKGSHKGKSDSNDRLLWQAKSACSSVAPVLWRASLQQPCGQLAGMFHHLLQLCLLFDEGNLNTATVWAFRFSNQT